MAEKMSHSKQIVLYMCPTNDRNIFFDENVSVEPSFKLGQYLFPTVAISLRIPYQVSEYLLKTLKTQKYHIVTI